MALGLTLGAALVDYGVSRGDLMLMGAITGAGVGGLQAIVMARQRIIRCGLVGSSEPARLGTCLAREFVRDIEQRREAVHELRR